MSDSSNAKAANDNSGDRGTKVTMVRTYPVLQNTDGRVEPYWVQRIHKFRALEIMPHLLVGDSELSYLEPCGAGDADTWIVIGRYASGNIEHCENFPTQAEASAFRDHLLSRYPSLALQEDWKTSGNAVCPVRPKPSRSWRVLLYPEPVVREGGAPRSGPFFRIFRGDDNARWVAQTNADLPRETQEEFALLIADALTKILP
jgi:hypothetical protein